MDQGNPPKKLERSIAEEFKNKKGELDMPPMDPDNEIIRISLSHPFPEKDRVAWISIPFTRKELATNDPAVDQMIRDVVNKVKVAFPVFDADMKMVDPIIKVLAPAPGTPNAQPQQPGPAQPAPASADGTAPQACEVCGVTLFWKPPGVNFQTKAPYEGFWACPNYKAHGAPRG